MSWTGGNGNAQKAIGKCDAICQHKEIKPECGCLVAQDKDQDWGTSGVSVVCQRPPKHHQLRTLLFSDDVTMVSPRSQSDLFKDSLLNVWNRSVSWDLPINTTKCKYIAIERAPPLQFPAIWAFSSQFFITLHPLQTCYLQSKTDVVYDKAVVHWNIRAFTCVYPSPVITHLIEPTLSTLCRPVGRTLLPTPTDWRKSSAQRRGS